MKEESQNLNPSFAYLDEESLKVAEYVRNDILSQELSHKKESDDFAAVLVDGRDKRFGDEYELAALKAIKLHSEYNYPILLFLNENYCKGILSEQIIKEYRIQILPIKPILNWPAVSEFHVFHLYDTIDSKYENLLIFQVDGFPIKSGWENFVVDFGYIGAHWQHYARVDCGLSLPPTCIGNGGFSFRKLSKMREINKAVRHLPMKELGKDNFPPEDCYYSYFGFGLGICNPPSLEECDTFSIEPIDLNIYHNKKPFGFHKFINKNPYIRTT